MKNTLRLLTCLIVTVVFLCTFTVCLTSCQDSEDEPQDNGTYNTTVGTTTTATTTSSTTATGITDAKELKILNTRFYYDINSRFDYANTSVVLVGSDGEETPLDTLECTVKGFDSSEPGVCNVTLRYNELSVIFTVTIVDPIGTPDAPDSTKPTYPAKDGQLTLSLLIGIMKSDMKWSDIRTFTHTDVDASHATFAVADNYGKECTLAVTYDAATDVISEATLSYGDTSVNVLSDDTLVVREIMIAMNEN